MRVPLLVLLALSISACGPPDAAPDATAPPVDADLVVHVSGLVCDRCAAGLSNALGDLDGVTDVAVDLDADDQRARVALADGATVTEAAVREAVADAGFVTRRVDSSPARP